MEQTTIDLLTRIADALERLAPSRVAAVDLTQADAFVWHPSPAHLAPVWTISRVEIGLLAAVTFAISTVAIAACRHERQRLGSSSRTIRSFVFSFCIVISSVI